MYGMYGLVLNVDADVVRVDSFCTGCLWWERRCDVTGRAWAEEHPKDLGVSVASKGAEGGEIKWLWAKRAAGNLETVT